jgi:hypothetical protein
MEEILDILYSEKNVNMVAEICNSKLHNITGILFDRNEESYSKSFERIFNLIAVSEVRSQNLSDARRAVIKINNIIIKEFISSTLSQLENRAEEIEHTTKLSEMSYEEPEKVEIKPEFKYQLCEITNENSVVSPFNTYSVEIDLKAVRSVSVVDLFLDKSDYNITEFCNTFSINGKDLQIPIGNYHVEMLAEAIQREIDININTDKKFLMKLTVEFKKLTEGYSISYRNVLQSETEGQSEGDTMSIDFSTKNSIGPVLGFEEKQYIVKLNETICGDKNHLSYSRNLELRINFTDKLKGKYSISLDVANNCTKYFKPAHTIYIANEDKTLFDLEKITFSFTDENKRPYNFRKRNFGIKFLAEYLVN